MGRRSRRRSREGDAAPPMPDAPTAQYSSDDGMALELRCVMSPKTRAQYAKTVEGNLLSQEDAWHRAMEFLFERLALGKLERLLDELLAARRQRGALLPHLAAENEEFRVRTLHSGIHRMPLVTSAQCSRRYQNCYAKLLCP